jgi:uroporphyrin-III C-methyltransferase / precorrin-2 dehydrogenase / sirohydrochlorin ferrochelatase
MHSLPLFHRIAGRAVIVVGDGPSAEAKRDLIVRAGGVIVGEEDCQARLAFVAASDAALAEAAARRLQARGVLVNVVDRPALCDFTTPSVLQRGPVLVAVGTGGASAGLAKALRLRLEGLIPGALGRLASGLEQARAGLRARWPDAGDRRRALDAALSPGGPLDPLHEEAAEALAGWLAGPAEAAMPQLTEIVLRSDDPDDLTLREMRLLGSADVIRHEPGVPAAILARARADALRRPLDSPAEAGGAVVVIRRARADDRAGTVHRALAPGTRAP